MKNFEGPSREIEGASPNRVPSRNFLKRNAMQFTAGTGDANASSLPGAPSSDKDKHTPSTLETPSHSGKIQSGMFSLSHEKMVNQGYGQVVAILQKRGLLGDQAAEKMPQYIEGGQNAENINALQRGQSLADHAFSRQRESILQREITNLWKSRSTPPPSTQWPHFIPGSRPGRGIGKRDMHKWLGIAIDVVQIWRRGRSVTW